MIHTHNMTAQQTARIDRCIERTLGYEAESTTGSIPGLNLVMTGSMNYIQLARFFQLMHEMEEEKPLFQDRVCRIE